MSGKNTLAPPLREERPEYRLISGKPSRHLGHGAGNPEGSPSDPVTTDPKGEALRLAVEPQIQTVCNTPALISKTRAVYGAGVPLDPWFVRELQAFFWRSKAQSFAAFRDVCRMIEQGDHLRRDGVRDIVDIAYGMNPGKRRLAHDDLLRALDEVKG